MRDRNETIIFETPTNDKASDELIDWITKTLKSKINVIIPTHFHDDNIGELQVFEEKTFPLMHISELLSSPKETILRFLKIVSMIHLS